MAKLMSNEKVQGGNVKTMRASLLYNSSSLTAWLLTMLCSTSALAETDLYIPEEIVIPAPQISTDAIDPDKAYYYRDPMDALNESWLTNKDDAYEGSAALGKLLKMGLKATYKSFKNRGDIANSLPDENGNGSLASMKYKLRLKSDTVRLKFEYKF